jgi:hypothetical protein
MGLDMKRKVQPNKPSPDDLARIDAKPDPPIHDKDADPACARCGGTGLIQGDYRNKGYVCPCTFVSGRES